MIAAAFPASSEVIAALSEQGLQPAARRRCCSAASIEKASLPKKGAKYRRYLTVDFFPPTDPLSATPQDLVAQLLQDLEPFEGVLG